VFTNASTFGRDDRRTCKEVAQEHLPLIPIHPTPLTLQCDNVDASQFHIWQALYASAAVPGLLTPLRVRGYDETTGRAQYLKLMDGGVWDNTGAVTLYLLTDQALGDSCDSGRSIRSV